MLLFEIHQKFKAHFLNELHVKQKLTLQKTIDSLRQVFEKETLETAKNQDLGSISKAALFLCTIN